MTNMSYGDMRESLPLIEGPPEPLMSPDLHASDEEFIEHEEVTEDTELLEKAIEASLFIEPTTKQSISYVQ